MGRGSHGKDSDSVQEKTEIIWDLGDELSHTKHELCTIAQSCDQQKKVRVEPGEWCLFSNHAAVKRE